MAFTKDATRVRSNGRTIVMVNTGSGLADVGFVAAVTAMAKVITEETTLGDLPIAWDLAINYEMKQTTGADFSDIIDARFPTSVQARGNNDYATLDNPTQTPDLDKKFDGKAGSKITVSAQFKGASAAQAKAFITNAS
jgi:hypothetical protein